MSITATPVTVTGPAAPPRTYLDGPIAKWSLDQVTGVLTRRRPNGDFDVIGTVGRHLSTKQQLEAVERLLDQDDAKRDNEKWPRPTPVEQPEPVESRTDDEPLPGKGSLVAPLARVLAYWGTRSR